MCVCIRVCVGVHVCLDYTSYRMFQNSFQRTDLPLNPYNFDCTPNRTFHNTSFVTQYSLYSADFWNNLYNPNYKIKILTSIFQQCSQFLKRNLM